MTTSKTLLVKIRADKGGFDRDMQSAGKSVGGFRSRLKAVGPALVASAAALGVAATAAFRFSKAIAAGLDDLGKWSQRLEVSASQLAGWQFAAEQSGSSAAILNKTFFQLSRTIGESIDGNEEYAASFRQLGLDVEKLSSLSIDEQFAAVTQALKDQEKQSTRNAISQQVLGRGAKDLAVLLNLSAAEMASLVGEGQRLRGATESNTAAAAEFNDAMNRLKTSLRGAAEQVGPLLEGLGTFLDWITEGVQGMKNFQGGIQVMLLAVADLARIFSDDLADSIQSNVDFAKIWEGAVKNATTGTSSLITAADRAKGASDDAAESVKKLAVSADTLGDAMKRQGEIIKRSVETPMERYTRQLKELHELLVQGTIDSETFARATAKAKRELERDTQSSESSILDEPDRRDESFRQVVLNRLDLNAKRSAASKPEVKTSWETGRRLLERIAKGVENPRATALILE